MSSRILCVDDEPNILHAFLRQFRRQFEVFTALGPEMGLKTISQDGPFAVVVSDLRMPGMSGIQFLARVREASPDTVRIMLTGQADLQDAIAAVNQGHIFQFLAKPCPADMLSRAIQAALDQHSLIIAERELVEQTLMSSIGVMAEILSLVNPFAFSRGQRIRRYVRHVAEKLNLADRWQYEFAAMLSQIGCVTIPAEDLQRLQSERPSEADKAMIASQAQIGHDLLAKIPRLDVVAGMVQRQTTLWAECAGQGPAALGGHLLKVALDFDNQLASGGFAADILARMGERGEYNLAFLDALSELQVEAAQSQTRLLMLAQLAPGMITNCDVTTGKGMLLLAKGHEITQSTIACLLRVAETGGVCEPISVLMPEKPVPAAVG